MQPSPQLEKMIYKILVDILSLLFLVFFFDLVIDSIVPGLLAGFFSFTKLVFLIIAVTLALIFLGRRNKIEFAFDFSLPQKNKTAFFSAVVVILLLISSLVGLNPLEIFISVLIAIFILFYIFQVLFNPES